ncbi:hypothetical protein BC829DRAFT_446242 [Chytridium lagenaria]|nr:hypothetical protein BC829DRAFT_446242 [Chytridium lagenaria]
MRKRAKGEKAFIIARVQTWDPKQPDKAFYSYYDAFQLNKILFQTQESPKLLVGPAKVESKRRSVQLPPPISTTRSGPPILNDPSMLISPTVREVEAGNTTWTRTGPVVVDISESEVGDMSRRKSSIAFLLRRVSQAVSPPKGGHVSAPGNAAAPITSNPEPNVEATSSHQKSMSGTLDREVNGTSPQSRAEAPAGQITRFCVPVSPNDITAMTPKTVKSRRRSLSYANTCNAGGAAASYDDQSNVFSPKSATIKEVDEDVKEEDEKEESPPASPFQGANVEEEMPIQTFDATLFATDNDFLESSRIRSIFKQNAVHTEDAVLFEMKEFTGVEVAESPVIIIVEDNPACEFCYPSPATLSRATPLMRTFHRTKCYIAAFLLILAMFFL